MTTDEFKAYQKNLNRIREAKIKECPLPKAKALLEPDVKLTLDVSDLNLQNIPINIQPPVQPTYKDEPVKSNSVSLF